VLLFLLSGALLFTLQKRPAIASVFLALVIITKPFFGLMYLPLLLRRHFKVILFSGLFTIGFMIIPSLLTGISGNVQLHIAWFQTILDHNTGFPSSNTIDSLARIYLKPDLPSIFQYIVLAASCAGVAVLCLINLRSEKQNSIDEKSKNRNFTLEWFVLIALMPSLFPTDTQHFLFSLPLIMILLGTLRKSKNAFLIILFILLIFFYEGNTSDLIGKKMARSFDELGVLGITNIVLCALSIAVVHNSGRQSRIPKSNTNPA
jgi:hypothetical protein